MLPGALTLSSRPHRAPSSCRDTPFLLLFAAFWGGVIAIAAVGFRQGTPQTLIYGLDYAGHVCGKNNKARASDAETHAVARVRSAQRGGPLRGAASRPSAHEHGRMQLRAPRMAPDALPAECAPHAMHVARGWSARRAARLSCGTRKRPLTQLLISLSAPLSAAVAQNTTNSLDLTKYKAQYWLNPNEVIKSNGYGFDLADASSIA